MPSWPVPARSISSAARWESSPGAVIESAVRPPKAIAATTASAAASSHAAITRQGWRAAPPPRRERAFESIGSSNHLVGRLRTAADDEARRGGAPGHRPGSRGSVRPRAERRPVLSADARRGAIPRLKPCCETTCEPCGPNHGRPTRPAGCGGTGRCSPRAWAAWCWRPRCGTDVVWRPVAVVLAVWLCRAAHVAPDPPAGDGRARVRRDDPAPGGLAGGRPAGAGRAVHQPGRARAGVCAAPVGIGTGDRAGRRGDPRGLRAVGGHGRHPGRRADRGLRVPAPARGDRGVRAVPGDRPRAAAGAGALPRARATRPGTARHGGPPRLGHGDPRPGRPGARRARTRPPPSRRWRASRRRARARWRRCVPWSPRCATAGPAPSWRRRPVSPTWSACCAPRAVGSGSTWGSTATWTRCPRPWTRRSTASCRSR